MLKALSPDAVSSRCHHC